jgi:transcriptional regulator with XRE-family HTH domain
VGKGKSHAALYRSLVERLRDLRTGAGITQVELAERLGKPQSYVSKVERAERLLDPVELRWWCDALGAEVAKVVRDWTRP